MKPLGSEAEINRIAIEAAKQVGEAVGRLLREDPVHVGTHVYYLRTPQRLLMRMRAPRRLFSISKVVSGGRAGRISLALNQDSVAAVADRLVGRLGSPAHHTLDGLELDALAATANILAGAYLDRLGPALQVSAIAAASCVMEGPLQQVALAFLPGPCSLCVETRFELKPPLGEIVLLAAVESEQDFQPQSRASRRSRNVTVALPDVRF